MLIDNDMIDYALQARQHLRRLNCGFRGKETKVCCSSEKEVLVKSEELVIDEEEDDDYVETATCGIRSSFSVLISGGEETAPGDWPWMALLRYSDPVMYVKIPADCETVVKTRLCQALCRSSHLFPSCSDSGSLCDGQPPGGRPGRARPQHNPRLPGS